MLFGTASTPEIALSRKTQKQGPVVGRGAQGRGIHHYVILYGKKGRTVILESPFCFYGEKETQAGLTVAPCGWGGADGGASRHTCLHSLYRQRGGKQCYSEWLLLDAPVLHTANVCGMDATAPGGQDGDGSQLAPRVQGLGQAGPLGQRLGWTLDPQSSGPTVLPLRSCPALPATLPWCGPGRYPPGHQCHHHMQTSRYADYSKYLIIIKIIATITAMVINSAASDSRNTHLSSGPRSNVGGSILHYTKTSSEADRT